MTGSVTVVIPTRNRLHCLKRVLGTYFEQPAVARVIVVDDQSDIPISATDLVGDVSRPLLVERAETRGGAPRGRNRGSRHVETEWILYSDDDVFLAPGYVDALLRTQQQSGADIVAGRRIYLEDGESAEEASARCSRMPPQPFRSRYLDANFAAPIVSDMEVLHLQTTAMVRRSLWEALQWDEGYPPPSYREETDFFIRAAEAGHKLLFCRDGVCYHLPAEDTRSGGQRQNRWWTYELGVISNNHRFLDRHYPFLRSRGALDGPRWLAELRFVDWRLRGGLARALYARYYQSRVRTMFRRLVGRTT